MQKRALKVPKRRIGRFERVKYVGPHHKWLVAGGTVGMFVGAIAQQVAGNLGMTIRADSFYVILGGVLAGLCLAHAGYLFTRTRKPGDDAD